MNPCITIDNLTLSYQRHPAVHHVSGRFARGSLTAVTGPNGAGKSTLLKAIAGLITPEEGRIVLHDIEKPDIAYMPQIGGLRTDFPITVAQMAASGFWNNQGGLRAIDQASREKISEALAAVGLQGFGSRQIATLSVGQLQRALFARVILQDAKLILLDEPFNAVDEETTQSLLKIIRTWHQEKRTIICVVHDTDMILQHFTECLLIARECIAWGKSQIALQQTNLAKCQSFREAWQPHSEICHQ